MIAKTWKELSESGILWWINRSLHLFGWAIVLEKDEQTGEITKAYPAQVEYRGFTEEAEERGFARLTEYLKEHLAIGKESNEEICI